MFKPRVEPVSLKWDLPTTSDREKREESLGRLRYGSLSERALL